MADEAPGSTQAANAESPGTMVVPEEGTRIVTMEQMLPEKADIVDSRESLFSDEKDISEAELTGDASVTPAPGEKNAVTPPPEGDKAAPAAEDPAKPAAQDKPPEGFVPIAALHEERTKRKAADQRINELTVALTTVNTQAAPAAQGDPLAPFKDFKVLSRDEYNELVDEDVAAAQKYLGELNEYQEAKRQVEAKKAENERLSQTQRESFTTIVNNSKAAMEREVPGLYDQKSDVNEKLMQFAEAQGMDTDLLADLTDPATIITVNGKRQLMGEGSVAVLRMLNNMYKAEQTITQRVTEQVTNDIITKFKLDAGVYRSIGDNPSRGEAPADTGQVLTEADFRGMSEEDERKWLGG